MANKNISGMKIVGTKSAGLGFNFCSKPLWLSVLP